MSFKPRAAHFIRVATEVLPGVWLGDINDGKDFPGPRLAVVSPNEKLWEGEVRVPIEAPGAWNGERTVILPEKMEEAAVVLDRYLASRGRCLVRCAEGIQRSPLFLAYWLVTRKGQTWEEAYRLLKERRPQVRDERGWLPEGYLPPP